jgi:hypothetical protein
LGHKRSKNPSLRCLLYPPKAAIDRRLGNVRFVPIADIPPFKRRQLVYTGSMTY